MYISKIVITEEQNSKPMEDFTFKEFSLTMKQMHHDKSVGPDGLNLAFYQYFWNQLGRELFLSYKKWLEEVSLPANLNNTSVVLLPKKEKA